MKVKPIPWQNKRHVQIQVNDGERIFASPPYNVCIPLFAPFRKGTYTTLQYRLNEDHLVDVTSDMKHDLHFTEGENRVKLIQHGGLMKYAWVLVLHAPSAAQLRALQVHKDHESQWNLFRTNLLQVSPPSLQGRVPAIVNSLL